MQTAYGLPPSNQQPDEWRTAEICRFIVYSYWSEREDLNLRPLVPQTVPPHSTFVIPFRWLTGLLVECSGVISGLCDVFQRLGDFGIEHRLPSVSATISGKKPVSVDSSMTAPITDMNVWTKRGVDYARFSDDVRHRDANDQCVPRDAAGQIGSRGIGVCAERYSARLTRNANARSPIRTAGAFQHPATRSSFWRNCQGQDWGPSAGSNLISYEN